MRRFAPKASVCTALFFAHLVFATLGHTQQVDIAVGGGTTLSAKSKSASEADLPPTEKGGVYPAISADIVFKERFGIKRVGLEAETTWRDKEASFNGYEKDRPILTDFNVLLQPQMSRKLGFDLLAGVGISSTRFYIPGGNSCGSTPGTCYTSADHFLEHLGAGARYYVWHRLPNVFVRPEIHYYRIQNNYEFHSNNLFRASFSVGYTFGGR